MIDWKALTRELADTHREHGVAVVKWCEHPGLVAVSVSDEQDLFSCPGRDIRVKLLRSHLWNLRYERKMQKDRLVLWSVYDEDSDTSYVGVGLQVRPELLSRVSVRVLEAPNG